MRTEPEKLHALSYNDVNGKTPNREISVYSAVAMLSDSDIRVIPSNLGFEHTHCSVK